MIADRSFLKNVATMLSGTVVAQAIPIALSPVLTRLYAPSDYGGYAQFALVSVMTAALASARFELAIMLPKRETGGANILVLTLGLAVIAGVLCEVGCGGWWLLHHAALVGTPVTSWMWWVGPMVTLTAVFQGLNYWQLRKQSFRALSASRVARAMAMGALNVTFGLLGFGTLGLVGSSLLGQAILSFGLLWATLASDRADFRLVSYRRVRALARKHRHFAFYSLPADLLSVGAHQLPVLTLPKATAGLFGFTQTVMSAPLTIIAAALLDVFKERATRDFRERGEFRAIFVGMAKPLSALGACLTLVLLLAGRSTFAFAFGAKWADAGIVARCLAVMYGLKLVVSPLSYAYYIVGKQREDFHLHVYIAATSAAILLLGPRWFGTFTTLTMFAMNYAALYVVYFVRSNQFSKGHARS
jgi:O-antigen/teichoic acid export membrane protein